MTLFPFIHIPETGNAEGRQKSWSIYQYQIIFSDIIFEFDKSIYINCNDICVLILCCVILNTGEMSEIMFLGWTISPKLFCSDKYYRDPYKVREIPKFPPAFPGSLQHHTLSNIYINMSFMCIAIWMHHYILLAVFGKSLGCWGSFCGCFCCWKYWYQWKYP